MKVVHLILGRANPNRMNGVNRVVHNLALSQQGNGMDVEVWGITPSFEKPDEVSRSYKTRWFKPKGWFGVDASLKDAIKNIDDAHCFHLHGGFIPVFYTIQRIMKSFSKSFVITPHGTYTKGAMSGNKIVKQLYFSLFEKRVLKAANKVQCLGHAEESDLRDLYKDVKVVLIPNGQNFDELKADDSEIEKDKEFVIGYCGRISRWQKGLDILLESFIHYKKFLKGKGSLHLIGDGEYLKEMKSLAEEANVHKSILFHGKQYGADKVSLLTRMDLFVHTSRNEGLPTAVIEAASLGIACLVTEMTSMDRYVKTYDAGWVNYSMDPKEIALQFFEAEKAYKNGTLELKGSAAKTMAIENFDWAKVAEQTLDMYAK